MIGLLNICMYITEHIIYDSDQEGGDYTEEISMVSC